MFLLEKHFFIFVLPSGICGLYNKLKTHVKLDQIDPQTSASNINHEVESKLH